MQFIVTAEEMKEYDNNTIEYIGIPGLVLMERAALKVKEAILEEIQELQSVLIVTGAGNNGGDGLALARLYAAEGIRVTVCCFGNLSKATESFLAQREILKHYPVELFEGEKALECLKEYVRARVDFDVIVDALFGVGLSRPLEGIYNEVIIALNNIRGFKVAVDIPSGICANTGKELGYSFAADMTVTFGFAKRGLFLFPGAYSVGKLVVADIGIDERSFMEHPPRVFTYRDNPCKYMPVRRRDGNKGTFGKVLLIAGFEKMAGAAMLSTMAALRMGAGMVKVILAPENRSILQSGVPEVMCAEANELSSCLDWADVVAIGPGLGKSEEVKTLFKDLLQQSDLPLIVDADAINILSEDKSIKDAYLAYKGVKIMTPHMGEWSRLTGISVAQLKENFFDNASKSAQTYNAIMVCKDARTLVAHPDGRMYLNTTGNNGMATAGCGDVLTGAIAALLGQSEDAFAMVTVAVYLHGLSGDLAFETYTEYGVTAGRLIDNLRIE